MSNLLGFGDFRPDRAAYRQAVTVSSANLERAYSASRPELLKFAWADPSNIRKRDLLAA